MKFEFSKNKYSRELLIDCFEKKGLISIESPNSKFFVTFYELIFITNGQGIFCLESEIIPFKKGMVLFLPPNKWREWVEIDDSFAATYLIFEEEMISSFFNDALYLYRLNYFYSINTPSFIHLNNKKLNNFIPKLEELQEELRNLNSDSSHLLRSILYYILIHLNRLYKTEYSIKNEFYLDTKILEFKKALEHNIKNKHKVTEYSELLGVSRSHLNKLLKKYFGKSCSEIIKERLITEIKRTLLFSSKSVSEISYELNFSEPSNLNRFFHNAVGMTPKEYKIQNDNSKSILIT